MRNKLAKTGLIVLLILLAVSCRNYVFVPIPGSGGGVTTLSNAEKYQATYASVDWDSIVEQAVNQAGQGLKNNMESTLRDSGTATMGLTAANASPNARATTTAEAVLVLTIEFHGYTDSVSGVTISSGTMSFTLSATRTTTTDDAASTTTNRYDINSYSAETTAPLTMVSAETTATVNVSNVGTDTGIQMTVSVTGTVAEGEKITGAVATNVSLNVAVSTGAANVGGENLPASEVKPENPAPVYPIGSEQKPYEVATVDDVTRLMTTVQSGTPFYVDVVADIVFPASESSSITIPTGYELHIDLNGHRLSRISEFDTDPDELFRSCADNSKVYFIFVDGGTLYLENGILGGTLLENPVARLVSVKNKGRIYADNLTVYQFTNTAGTAINVDNGFGDVRNTTIYATGFALAVGTSAEVYVDNCFFSSVSSNALSTSEGANAFTYVISANGTFEMDNTTVYGIQGGISVNGGSTRIGKGVKSYTVNTIFDVVPEDFHTYYLNWLNQEDPNHTIGSNELWAALYVSGESSSSRAIVEGGIYISDGENMTIRVGNTSDGGLGKAAYAEIKDGIFENRGDGYVVKDEDNIGPQDYGYGQLTITGGKFKDRQTDTREWLEGFVNPETHVVSETTDDGGYYTVTAISDN